MSCSLSQMTSVDIGGNATDAEGGNSDAEKACESGVGVVVPESLLTPLPRHVTADSCSEHSSRKVLDSNTQ